MESPVAHDESKRIETDLTFADVLMSIHPRAARRFGIVHVDRGETIATNYAIECQKRSLNGGFAPDIITGGENVRGIETNAKSLGLADVLYNISDLFKAMTET